MSDIYELIAADPFIQQAKYTLEELDEQIGKLTRLKDQTQADKIKRDALIMKWATLKTQYDRAIKAHLEGAVA